MGRGRRSASFSAPLLFPINYYTVLHSLERSIFLLSGAFSGLALLPFLLPVLSIGGGGGRRVTRQPRRIAFSNKKGRREGGAHGTQLSYSLTLAISSLLFFVPDNKVFSLHLYMRACEGRSLFPSLLGFLSGLGSNSPPRSGQI